jgi:CitMHS family citrate-Mg2+:H+ or citrate-Ca2+:H+ symporter
VAIIASPTVVAALAGFGPKLPEMMLSGIETVAPTAVLLLFAVLYFGLMMDAKLFDPVSNALLRLSRGDPVRILMGTAVLALLVALDGDGTTSYMIICSAFLPVYLRLGVNPLAIALIATLSLGLISGATPWGGAATRGISVLGLDANAYFTPLVPAMALTCLSVVGVAAIIGLRARRGIDPVAIAEIRAETDAARARPAEPVPWRMWFNAGLTALLLTLLFTGLAPLVVLFMMGFVVALVVNLPRLADQREFVRVHACNAIPVVLLVLAAGIFTGILSEAGMTSAMASALLAAVPEGLHGLIPLFTAFISLPLSFFMSNDAFFFGIVPVLAESGAKYGIPSAEIARAAVVGQMMHSIGPASAPLWVLLGLVNRDLGEFQRYALLWVIAVSLAFIAFAVITGAISVSI